MAKFEVHIVAADGSLEKQKIVAASSPRHAAIAVCGDVGLKRGGKLKPGALLRAKVYYNSGQDRTMVRYWSSS